MVILSGNNVSKESKSDVIISYHYCSISFNSTVTRHAALPNAEM